MKFLISFFKPRFSPYSKKKLFSSKLNPNQKNMHNQFSQKMKTHDIKQKLKNLKDRDGEGKTLKAYKKKISLVKSLKNLKKRMERKGL